MLAPGILARDSVARHRVERAPDDWVTGAEPMTAAQAAYLKRLCEHAGEAFEAKLTKAEASKRIELLRVCTRLERRAG
ncbi:MAG: DUF3072 domain-containing protein [Deltaproteobacteria bacterium]